jgi:hypothetical protein
MPSSAHPLSLLFFLLRLCTRIASLEKQLREQKMVVETQKSAATEVAALTNRLQEMDGRLAATRLELSTKSDQLHEVKGALRRVTKEESEESVGNDHAPHSTNNATTSAHPYPHQHHQEGEATDSIAHSPDPTEIAAVMESQQDEIRMLRDMLDMESEERQRLEARNLKIERIASAASLADELGQEGSDDASAAHRSSILTPGMMHDFEEMERKTQHEQDVPPPPTSTGSTPLAVDHSPAAPPPPAAEAPTPTSAPVRIPTPTPIPTLTPAPAPAPSSATPLGPAPPAATPLEHPSGDPTQATEQGSFAAFIAVKTLAERPVRTVLAFDRNSHSRGCHWFPRLLRLKRASV